MDSSIQNITDVVMAQPAMPHKLGKIAKSSPDAIDKTAKDFEAMFVTQMLKPMFDSVPVNDTFGGGHGEEVMRSFMLQEYGKKIADSGAIGLSPAIKHAIIQEQQLAQSGGRHVAN